MSSTDQPLRSVLMRPGVDLQLRRPGIDYYCDRIRRRDFFSFPKMNHGYWKYLVLTDRRKSYYSDPRNGPWECYSERVQAFFAKLDATGFADCGLEFWPEIPHDPRFFCGASLDNTLLWVAPDDIPAFNRGYLVPLPRSQAALEKDRRGNVPATEAAEAIRMTVPDHLDLHCGLVFKYAAVHGGLERLYAALTDIHCVLVAPDRLVDFGERHGLPHAVHVPVSLTSAARERQQTVDQLHTLHQRFRGEPVVYLFQCGDAISSWIIGRLHGHLANAFLIDMGRALDLMYPEFSLPQGWINNFLMAVANTAERIGHTDAPASVRSRGCASERVRQRSSGTTRIDCGSPSGATTPPVRRPSRAE